MLREVLPWSYVACVSAPASTSSLVTLRRPCWEEMIKAVARLSFTSERSAALANGDVHNAWVVSSLAGDHQRGPPLLRSLVGVKCFGRHECLNLPSVVFKADAWSWFHPDMVLVAGGGCAGVASTTRQGDSAIEKNVWDIFLVFVSASQFLSVAHCTSL